MSQRVRYQSPSATLTAAAVKPTALTSRSGAVEPAMTVSRTMPTSRTRL